MGRDPTDSGGLFTGRPRAKYNPPGDDKRSYDRPLALLVALLMVVLAISLWGPLPLLALWLGSQIQYLLDSPFAGFVATFLIMMAFLFSVLAVLVRLDRFWVTVRRAQGVDQQKGILATVLIAVFGLGLAAFLFWFIFISGFGPSYSF